MKMVSLLNHNNGQQVLVNLDDVTYIERVPVYYDDDNKDQGFTRIHFSYLWVDVYETFEEIKEKVRANEEKATGCYNAFR